MSFHDIWSVTFPSNRKIGYRSAFSNSLCLQLRKIATPSLRLFGLSSPRIVLSLDSKVFELITNYSQQAKLTGWRRTQSFGVQTTLCSQKNTHSHFLSYLHELFVDLNKNCSEYTQGLTDSDNVKIRYSLRSMT